MNENDSTTTITDQLNSLRLILRSDDHLQIQLLGDYEQVRIKLDHDIQISFFFNTLNILHKSLTINNIHDLRIHKSSNKCSLNNDQWTNIHKYFDEIIQQSNEQTSVQYIIQLIQDRLLQIALTNKKFKHKTRKSAETISTTTNKFHGYEDRFTGIHEIAFNEFKTVHEHEYGVPMHRIQYYKINEQIVWDRTKKLDILTGGDQLNEASNALIYTPQRYQSILETLKSLLPDFICLQEVTVNFLNLLLNETWLQENNYYIIITKKVIDSNKKKSYGQMMIMKNFRPRSFSICPLD
ncbi:unnamed protein product, partial [Rotaria sp. Silwood2]